MASTKEALWAYAEALPTACEESRRTKISRTYYALYHHALDFHLSLPENERGLAAGDARGVHQVLLSRLANPQTKDLGVQTKSRKIGTYLRLARELREDADYHNDKNVSDNDVRRCLKWVSQGLEA